MSYDYGSNGNIAQAIRQTNADGSYAETTRLRDGGGTVAASRTNGTGLAPSTTTFAWDNVGAAGRLTALASAATHDYIATAAEEAGGVTTGLPSDAFGSTLTGQATDPWGASPSQTVSDVPRLGYRAELQFGGLIDLRARDYESQTGLFTSRDALDGVDGTTTLASSYPYANNDPSDNVDPSGMQASDGAFAVTLDQVRKTPKGDAAIGSDDAAEIAWRHMANADHDFQDYLDPHCGIVATFFGCRPPDPFSAMATFIGESGTGHEFDPKPALRSYFQSSASPPYAANELVDIGDPTYLYYYDVLGNAMWGSIAQKYLALSRGVTQSLIRDLHSLPLIGTFIGKSDPGDDITLGVGFEAGRRYGDALTLGEVLAAIRSANGDLIAHSRGNLDIGHETYNKLVSRTYVS